MRLMLDLGVFPCAPLIGGTAMRKAVMFSYMTFLLAPPSAVAEPAKQSSSKRAPAFTNSPFKAGTVNLPKDFLGTDPVGLIRALLKSPEPTKGEFETTDEFSDRRDKWLARPVLGTLTPTSLIALTFRPGDLPFRQASFEYNADTSIMTLAVQPSTCGDPETLAVRSQSRDVGSYVGQNAFGVRKLIKKTGVTEFCIGGVSQFQYAFPVPRDRAPTEKRVAKFVLIGKLKSPYANTAEEHTAPKIDSPYDIRWVEHILTFDVKDVWIISGATGEILYRSAGGATLEPEADDNQADDALLSQVDGNGNNRLHLAIWDGRTKKVLAIIDKQVLDLNASNKFGSTALHLAVVKENLPVVQALIRAGASCDSRDSDGATPLMYATKSGNNDIIQALKQTCTK
jgi:hypothetical protein